MQQSWRMSFHVSEELTSLHVVISRLMMMPIYYIVRAHYEALIKICTEEQELDSVLHIQFFGLQYS